MDNEILVAFGKTIKKRRQNLKITQEELAYRAELDRTFISYVENAHKLPSLISVFQFAKGLDLSPSDLIAEVEKELKR
ncbi:helix-turn-helix domain-containing protein [Paenibacillaceae bacterium WGS1546]|uniref:helix-turn-helix domain-containing protein n=1 Tax=Cohnella sp. WGS1546 TaxID=3366810 RepID=UPI00372CFE62